METKEWLEGAIAVQAALEADSREIRLITIRADRLDARIAAIQQQARHMGIPFERLPVETFNSFAPSEHTGGVFAWVGPRRFVTLADLIRDQPKPVIMMLDGVEDPYNYGQALRGLYAAGIDGLVVRSRNWFRSAATLARSSAGASERMPIALTSNPEEAADYYRNAGLKIACAAADRALPMTEVDLTGPLFLVIGGEKRGISRSFFMSADLRIAIPYGRDFPQALGTAGAATVLAFEILRQRQAG